MLIHTKSKRTLFYIEKALPATARSNEVAGSAQLKSETGGLLHLPVAVDAYHGQADFLGGGVGIGDLQIDVCEVAHERIAHGFCREHLPVGRLVVVGRLMDEVLHLPAVLGRHLVGVGYLVHEAVVPPRAKILVAAFGGTACLALVAAEAVAVAGTQRE